MPLITTIDLGKSYGPVDIFSHLSLSIPHRARIGLVGSNGVGKTTLLRILLGMEEPSAGEVQRSRGLRVGYLPQEASFEESGTLWQACLAAFSDLLERQGELARLEAAMSDPGQAEAALEAYGRLQHAFDHLGGYTYETRIRQMLTGLGFSAADEQRPLEQLSGGQRTRALLARLLLTDPDLLLLDEPTNHLDIAAIEWLEDYLRDWGGAVLIVSHDRYFLDQVVNSIWEMIAGAGSVTTAITAPISTSATNATSAAWTNTRRSRNSSKKRKTTSGATLPGRTRARRRGGASAWNACWMRRASPRRARRAGCICAWKPPGAPGDLVVRTQGLSVGYADEGRPLFHVPDLALTRGECAAVIGPNGAGKTTFLKTLLEQIPPYGGEARLGASLQIGYFAQAHEGLHAEWTLIEEIKPRRRQACARVKFAITWQNFSSPAMMFSRRWRCSRAANAGGWRWPAWRCRAPTCCCWMSPPITSTCPRRRCCNPSWRSYGGTILLVSHDRYLIDALATQIWEVLPDEQALRVFTGSYSEYKAARQAEAAQKSAPPPIQPARAKAEAPRQPTNGGMSKMEQRKRRQKIEALEDEIASLEAQLAVVARQLETPSSDLERIRRLGHDYTRLHTLLEDRMEAWGALNT